MKSLLFFVILTILAVSFTGLTGCNKDQSTASNLTGDSGELIIVDISDPFDPDDVQIDPFEINETRVTGDILTLSVSYSGGCQSHQLKLYSTRAVMESLPPQASAWLSHNGNGDMCEAYITEEVTFNLSELKDREHGSLLLRLHPYRQQTPIEPLILYEW